MEYTIDHSGIGFRAVYSLHPHIGGRLAFAAHPMELLCELPKGARSRGENFMVYGSVGRGERLEVGFRPFRFPMDPQLHERLGLLYEEVIGQYRSKVMKRE